MNISDNGKGFKIDPEGIQFNYSKGFGLFGISERVNNIGGSFKIDSKPGEGTVLTVKVEI